jgi:NAD(P)-dependent dehydrogenase (short-subunit alcohol dehydrogenase family)
MTGMKDTIHTEYLRSLEAKRKLPELHWKDRTILVVGSDQEINVGAMVASGAAAKGANVIEGDRDYFPGTQFKDKVTRATDLVICCASVHMSWIEDLFEEDVYSVVYDSLIAPINYTAMFAKHHVDTEHRKHIVFIGSMAYTKVLNASSIYCASKAGLAHFAQCCAWELTPKGFTIGTVHPGNIEGTPMTEETIKGIAKYRNISLDEARDYWASTKLTDKWLRPGEVADEVLRLLHSTPHHSGAQVELAGGMR